MAESLRHLIPDDAPRIIGAMIRRAWRGFALDAFVRDASHGLAVLDLMPRGAHIAAALRAHLPGDYRRAARVLVESMDAPLPLDDAGEPVSDGRPYSGFLYLPYSLYIAQHGLGHLDESLDAQHALTQRFTAEFCIRPYLEQHSQGTLDRLARWAHDPSAHVRRLVSEGTRPRLPWAPRLRAFMRDPAPVLPLLDALKDDPSSYVRRSVANHLNDIGKDHPTLMVELARQWLAGATPQRAQMVRHALRFAVKRGDPAALDALGMAHEVKLRLDGVRIGPRRPAIGQRLDVAFTLANDEAHAQHALVDLRVHYVKAAGGTSPRTFKLRTIELPPGQAVTLGKRISLAQMTTRVHHPGRHRVEALINGRAHPLGHFDLQRI